MPAHRAALRVELAARQSLDEGVQGRVAEQIVPKLNLIHHDVVRSAAKNAPVPAEIAEFCALAIRPDAAAPIDY